MHPRVLVALSATIALLFGVGGCGPGKPDQFSQGLARMKAVQGVTTLDGAPTAGSNGRWWYTFTGTLADNPSPDTLAGIVDAYRGTLAQLEVFHSELILSWRQNSMPRKLKIATDERRLVLDGARARTLASWPADLLLDAAGGQDGTLTVHLQSDDASFAHDVAAFASAAVIADAWGASSPRFTLTWNEQAPLELFQAVMDAAPNATKVAVSLNKPWEGSANDGTIEVTWGTTSDASADDELRAVTDAWSPQGRPTLLALSLGTPAKEAVSLNNNLCPTSRAPRNAEFWAYARRDGHQIALAPASC